MYVCKYTYICTSIHVCIYLYSYKNTHTQRHTNMKLSSYEVENTIKTLDKAKQLRYREAREQNTKHTICVICFKHWLKRLSTEIWQDTNLAGDIFDGQPSQR